jgi:hypothetical protein
MAHLSNYLFYFIPIASAMPLLASLTIFSQPPRQRYLKYFALFLLVNFLLDMATSYSAYYAINNLWLNNMDSMIVISFYLFLLREIVNNKKAKKVLLFFVLAYPVVSGLNIFFLQTSAAFHSMTYAAGCVLIITTSIYYFWELFQLKYSVNLIREPAFWICSGLLFYFACTFPINGLVNFVNALPKVMIQNLFQIVILLNFFLYLSFTIAYLCRVKTRKSM